MEEGPNKNTILIVGIILAIALVIVGFMVFGGKKQVGNAVNNESGPAKVTSSISVTYKMSKFSENVEVEEINLPLDSKEKTCKLWSQVFTKKFANAESFNCTFDESKATADVWVVDSKMICMADAYKCTGLCTGKIYKETGNIEDAFCSVVVN
jgi:hypothetical protein